MAQMTQIKPHQNRLGLIRVHRRLSAADYLVQTVPNPSELTNQVTPLG